MFHASCEALRRIGRPRIQVVGDVILDRYITGAADRVSPEAAVIVLRAEGDEVRLGGAASVAALLRGLEAEVVLAGVAGTIRRRSRCGVCAVKRGLMRRW